MTELIEETESWIDKSAWGEGLWQEEPDRVEWRDSATGLPCLALRHPRFGNWCGYVGVPPGHPWHGRDYDSSDLPEGAHNVHGGLTFAAPCMEDARPRRERVCHVPAPGEPDEVWWFGFDCSHGWDLSPGIAAALPPSLRLRRSETYKTLDYVRRNCAQLAELAGTAASS